MKCIYCGAPLAAIDYCPNCGADITIQKRIVRISNLLYNQGLEKALVRDMEGAITCLNRALKFNKENTDARNLLGLCYYEIGEAVSALCEWVISKNLQVEGNLADYYINAMQNDKNRLDTINQAIRKFNQSVQYCREDNEDMAIIQLKKVISQNPKLVKAYQLLALLYMKRSEYERARKLLRKAARIDMTNTTTLRYLQEIEEATGKGTSLERKRKKYDREETEEQIEGTLRYNSGSETVIQPATFRDSSTMATFINIILGILLGGAIVWFLIVPANRQSVNDSANKQVTEANSKLAEVQVQAQELEDQIEGYQKEADDAQQDREDALSRADGYDDLLKAANLYITGDQSTAANMLSAMDPDDFDDNAKALYETLDEIVASDIYEGYYLAGTSAYVERDYKTASEQLSKAVKADPDREQSTHCDALIYLGMSYYYLGESAKADDAFNQVVEYYPSSASMVEGYISSSKTSDGTSTNTLDLSGLGNATTSGNADAAADTAADSYTDYYGYTDNNSYTDNYSYTDTYGYTDDYGYTDGITVYDDSASGSSDVAWTDPTTGLQYDLYGNLIG